MRFSRVVITMIMTAFMVGLVPTNVRAEESVSIQHDVLEGEERDTFIKTAMSDDKVQRLQSFFADQDFEINMEETTVTRITLDEQTTTTVVLFSLQQGKDTSVAYLAYWDGRVNNQQEIDAVGAYEEEVYQVAQGEIHTVSQDAFVAKLSNPLLHTPGPVHSDTTITADETPLNDATISYDECKAAHHTYTQKTATGFATAYKWHVKKSWCHYFGKPLERIAVDVWISDVDPNFAYRGIVSQWDRPYSGGHTHDSYRQGHFENCIPYIGCIGNYYHGVTIKAYGSDYLIIPD